MALPDFEAPQIVTTVYPNNLGIAQHQLRGRLELIVAEVDELLCRQNDLLDTLDCVLEADTRLARSC